MTALKRDGFARALARWDEAIRLLLVAGRDESGIRDAATQAQAALADPADPMAVTDLTPEELRADPGRLADEAASVSMFGGRRLIRVTGAGENCAEAVRLLLAAPAAGNPVVMTAGDLGKVSGLRKLAEASPLALMLYLYPLDARDAARWAADKARALGLQPAPGVIERLLAGTDSDTGILARELEKYAIFLDATPEAPQRLEPDHVMLLGADSSEDDMAALVNAVMTGRLPALEQQMQRLSGDSAIPALRAVARRLLQLAEARAAHDTGMAPMAAVKSLRPPVFFKEVDAMAGALRHWPMPRIRAGLAAMLDGERAIKQPGGPGESAGWHAILSLGVGRQSA
ncbi:DNA polymerase III subunit delta [Sandaracinobacteroides sp. A072]|uniref:DNA polymerase III subunit delta n=1 Tax=Sandaracinobacteroides sp. A072 TaxID=3461146 RepID=UPI004042F34C